MRSEIAINPHERFEKLAALALIGELSAEEHQELKVHLKWCTACLQEYKEFDATLSHKLPLLHQQCTPLNLKRYRSGGSDDQSSSAATQEDKLAIGPQFPWLDGIVISRSVYSRLRAYFPRIAYAASAILSIVVAMMLFEAREQSKKVDSHIAALQNRIASLSREVHNQPVTTSPGSGKQVSEAHLQEERNRSARLAQRAQDLEQQLRASSEEINSFRDQLQNAHNFDKALVQRVSDSQKEVERVSAELQAALQDRDHALQDRDQTSVNLKNKETEMLAVEQELTDLRESADRNRALLAASYDITNLMGARNLRIIDVSDVDGKGKTRKAFGRVFFTEGKSLVFYAFDLGEVKSSARPASFQAWGSQGANLPTAKSLGIFFHDDHKSNRWVLKFDDPQVLSEIDSVFVTVEPLGGSKKPTGTPLLPAYLKAELNHP